MNERLRLTAERYGSDAPAYQALWAPVLLPHVRQLLPDLHLRDAERVLDAATGTGSVLPYLREAAPDARIFATDLAHGMILLADQEISRVVMDVQHLAFAEGSFDAALIAFALQHVPEPERAFASLASVLVPGGRLGTVTWAENPSFHAADVWGEELDLAGAETFPVIASPENVDHPDKVRAMAERAGMHVERVWETAGNYPMTPETFLLRFTKLGMNKRRYESLPHSERARFVERLQKRLEAMSEDDLSEKLNVIYLVART